jgi:hypothetical protein
MLKQTQIELAVFADYFQFYLHDEGENEDFGARWNDAAVERLLAVASHSVGIGTMRNASVPVAISVHAQEPAADFDEWDMVNECSITIRSGSIAISGCTDYLPDATRIAVQPGPYRVRVSYSGLDHVSADGIEGDDFYRVQLWPQAPGALSVVKAREALSR